MDLGLNGKIAMVAASSKGLGRACAHALAQEGARVSMCARNQDELEQAADSICSHTDAEVLTTVCDLRKAEDIDRFVSRTIENLGGVDILVCNTGGPPVGTFDELDESKWHQAHEQVLLSAVRLIRGATAAMKQRGGGRVINITSISAKQPIANLMLSNAYRAAVIGMGKTLATELAPDNILVNNICPGKIATDRLMSLDQSRAERAGISLESQRAAGQRAIPLGRYGQPEEFAALVAFLASSKASYVTGTTVLCDGGLFQGLM